MEMHILSYSEIKNIFLCQLGWNYKESLFKLHLEAISLLETYSYLAEVSILSVEMLVLVADVAFTQNLQEIKAVVLKNTLRYSSVLGH